MGGELLTELSLDRVVTYVKHTYVPSESDPPAVWFFVSTNVILSDDVVGIQLVRAVFVGGGGIRVANAFDYFPLMARRGINVAYLLCIALHQNEVKLCKIYV